MSFRLTSAATIFGALEEASTYEVWNCSVGCRNADETLPVSGFVAVAVADNDHVNEIKM